MDIKRFLKGFLTVVVVGIACLIYARNSFTTDAHSFFLEDTLYNSPDSLELQRRADSIAAYRSYMRSKRYNDSLDEVRKRRRDSIQQANQMKMDSLRAAQQRMLDSANAVRQRRNDSLQAYIAAKQAEKERYIDSINAVRKILIDSMDALKKYRNSKRYKDSVDRVQKARIDSMKAVQKAKMDSLMSARQKQLDSLNEARQRKSDSLQAHIAALKEQQAKRIDSLKQVQQARMDSLNKIKEAREEEMAKKQDEMRAQKRKATEEKIRKEREAYSNEKMLKKNWSLFRQFVQNTTTRYNYYFNARNKMKEAEDNMYRSKVDNLDSFISLLPFDPDVDAPKLQSDMDSLIRRISVGVQIHDPRVKWQDDLYLLLGKAFYYKGDYDNAAATFQYIVSKALEEEKKQTQKNKSKIKQNTKDRSTDIVSEESKSWFAHNPAKNDAILWLARVYTQQGEYVKAQTLLDIVRSSKNKSERLSAELDEAFARYYLAQGLTDQALPHLDSMTRSSSLDKKARHRSGFLAAQLYEASGAFDLAADMYEVMLDLNPPVELDFKASINQLIAKARSGKSDLHQAENALKRFTKEVKYFNFQDQIYCELAGIQFQLDEWDKAEASYKQSVRVPNAQAPVKGKSYFKLAEIYYNTNRYVDAKAAYDSALMFLSPDMKDMYALAQQRASGLATIAIPGAKVQALDSIIRLTQLSDQEKKEWAKAEVKRIKEQQSIQSGTTSGSINTNMNAGGSWYFDNEQLAKKGEAEFIARWGNRPLCDNWRRSQGTLTNSQSDDIPSNNDPIEPEAITETDLIALIPKDLQLIDSLHQARAKAYHELGHAFFVAQELNDAKHTFNNLIALYPTYNGLSEVYYDLYLITLGENDLEKAEQYKNTILTQYPNSDAAGKLAASTTHTAGTQIYSDDEINQHLDETYEMLNLGMFDEVIRRAEEVKTLYPLQAPRFMNKYSLMRAIAVAGKGDYAKADSMLSEIITINSNDSLTRWAKDVQEYLKSKLTMMQPAGTQTSSSSFLSPDLLNKTYQFEPNQMHYVMIYTKNVDGRFMGLKSGIADFNALNANTDWNNLELVMSELNSKEALFTIRAFANSTLAKAYLQTIKAEKQLLSGYTNPAEVTMVLISDENLKVLLVRKNIQDYLAFYYKEYR